MGYTHILTGQSLWNGERTTAHAPRGPTRRCLDLIAETSGMKRMILACRGDTDGRARSGSSGDQSDPRAGMERNLPHDDVQWS